MEACERSHFDALVAQHHRALKLLGKAPGKLTGNATQRLGKHRQTFRTDLACLGTADGARSRNRTGMTALTVGGF